MTHVVERKVLSESLKQSNMSTELVASSLMKDLFLQFWDVDKGLCKKREQKKLKSVLEAVDSTFWGAGIPAHTSLPTVLHQDRADSGGERQEEPLTASF